MRTGRTMENDDLNVTAAAGRGQQKTDASPQPQRRTTGLKTRSPSPARRQPQANGVSGGQQQPQNVRSPITSTAAKHCHECGEAFPVDWAKFCCECGEKRLGLWIFFDLMLFINTIKCTFVYNCWFESKDFLRSTVLSNYIEIITWVYSEYVLALTSHLTYKLDANCLFSQSSRSWWMRRERVKRTA